MAHEKVAAEKPIVVGDAHHHYHRHGNGVLGVFLIFLGFVFLLNNLQILPWSIWDQIWRFWPIFLILFGIHALVGKNSKFYFLVILLWILLIAFVFLVAAASVDPNFRSLIQTRLPFFPINTFLGV